MSELDWDHKTKPVYVSVEKSKLNIPKPWKVVYGTQSVSLLKMWHKVISAHSTKKEAIKAARAFMRTKE